MTRFNTNKIHMKKLDWTVQTIENGMRSGWQWASKDFDINNYNIAFHNNQNISTRSTLFSRRCT